MRLIQKTADAISGKAPFVANRSGQWTTVRKRFLETNGKCAVCNGTKNLEVHHKTPFHVHPELELDPTNFITLCESDENGVNCHLLFGHLGNFKSVNVNVTEDCATWNKKIAERPENADSVTDIVK